ncbi:MAG: hypothetical protein ACJ788_25970 [Ktedonobacteraceae bacterium]
MSQVFFVLLIVVVVYFLGLLIKPLGNMYGFFFSLLGIAGRSLKEMIGVLNTQELIPMLVFLMLGILVIGADCYGALLSLSIIYPEASGSLPDLGQFFSIASSSQFIAPAFLMGAIILEMEGYTHSAARLFSVGQYKRGFRLFVYSTLVLALLLGTSFYLARGVYLYLQNSTNDPSSMSTADPTGIMHLLSGVYPLLIVLVLTLIGLLTLLSAPIAGYCLVVGLQTVQRVVCSLASAIVSLGVEEVTYCQWFFSRSGLPSSQEKEITGNEFPQDTQRMQAGVASLPASNKKENEVSVMTEQLVCLTLNGLFGSRLLSPLVTALDRGNARKFIRSCGRVDLLSRKGVPEGLGIDVSCTERFEELASINWLVDAFKKHFDSMGNNIVQAHGSVADFPSLHVHVIDCRIGACALQMLRDNKRRLPLHTQVVVTAVSQDHLRRTDVQAFLKELATLNQEDIVATTIILDPNSPVACSLGEVKFYEYVARLLVDLIVAHTHSGYNLSALEVFHQLSRLSPFVSVAVATAPVSSGTTKKRWFWLRRFSDKAVIGNLEDILSQAKQVTKDVFEQAEKRACNHSLSRNTPCYLLFDTPISLADKRFRAFEGRNNQHVKQDFPNAHTLTISGSPVSPLSSCSPFLVGVACIYPVTLPGIESMDTPRPLKKEEERAAASPLETVVVDVPLPSHTLVGNGNNNRRSHAITKRSKTKKEK